ncbi:DUF3293 domain-containing protein [Ferrovibrio xuzhouensis]|uniref:DUF3293 domain-containing protein n=1 Tax=Ferrovibrio xuzhouensis TaxID=1576914 RepID=A0ABV7VFJ0_9PROT
MISNATLRGYAATTYGVTGPDGTLLGLRLGSHSPATDRLLRQLGAASLCCLNAWNPLSRRLPAARNMAAHLRLKRDLAARGLHALAHTGIPDNPHWQPEPGFAVLDLETEKAIRLGETYGQYAVVCYRRGETADLLLTRLARR